MNYVQVKVSVEEKIGHFSWMDEFLLIKLYYLN